MSDHVAAEPWMQGFPPAPDQRIRFDDGSYARRSQMRWSYNHMEQLVPTKAVWRGSQAVRALPCTNQLFADEASTPDIRTLDARTVAFDDALVESSTDGLAVLHRGELIYERYFDFGGPHKRHTMMSCNKSMVGTLTESLISDGSLDDSTLVVEILPKLQGSAWQTATVRLVMDMLIDMEFHEDYMDRSSDVWRFLRCTGMIPPSPGDVEAIADYLPSVAGAGNHGRSFAYREPNIFVLGWIVRRVVGTDIATLASDRIWQHLGAEHDWLYMIDSSGAETTALATLRDFARFGQLICDRGRIGDHQVVPPSAMAAILAGGDTEVFAAGQVGLPGTWSYRSQWWFRHVEDRVCPVARGAQGQLLYIDPASEIVIARYASPPMGERQVFDNLWMPIVDIIVAAVI